MLSYYDCSFFLSVGVVTLIVKQERQRLPNEILLLVIIVEKPRCDVSMYLKESQPTQKFFCLLICFWAHCTESCIMWIMTLKGRTKLGRRLPSSAAGSSHYSLLTQNKSFLQSTWGIHNRCLTPLNNVNFVMLSNWNPFHSGHFPEKENCLSVSNWEECVGLKLTIYSFP